MSARHRFLPLVLALIFSLASSVEGQTPAASSGSTGDGTNAPLSAADTAWINLQDLIFPPVSVLSASNQVALSAAAPADQFNRASEAALAFYTTYPTDPLAPEAKKIQAVMALQSAQLGGIQYQQTALALGNAYVANPQNAVQDRFDVALALLPLTGGIQGVNLIDDVATYEALGDTLHSEFGDIPEVYSFYFGIMRTVNAAGSVVVAQDLLAMPNAPATLKAEAQITIDRSNLVGKPLDLPFLMAANGANIDPVRGLYEYDYGKPSWAFLSNTINGINNAFSLHHVI